MALKNKLSIYLIKEEFCGDDNLILKPGAELISEIDGVGKVYYNPSQTSQPAWLSSFFVQAHAGGHGKGLVSQECHAEHTDCRGNTGSHEHAVPQGGAGSKVGQQIGIQRNDVRHGHKGRQTSDQFSPNSSLVFGQFENFF